MSRELWSADLYEKNARFVSDLGGDILTWLNPVPGERILDLGCGDGVLTNRIAAAGATIVGVDSSPDMVAAARARGVDARIGDATALEFDREFDAVFSNAALHWTPRAEDVVSGVAKALKDGGRFVAEFGGFGNIAAIRTALIAVLAQDYEIRTDLRDIWYFPTPDEYSAVCENAGFEVERIELAPRPTPVSAGMEQWLETLAAPALAMLPAESQSGARRRAVEMLAPALRDASGRWTADYVRLRVSAKFPGSST